jgi:hypothetical protein
MDSPKPDGYQPTRKGADDMLAAFIFLEAMKEDVTVLREALTQARPSPDLVEAAERVAIWIEGIASMRGQDLSEQLVAEATVGDMIVHEAGSNAKRLREALMSTNPPSIDTSEGGEG